MKVRHLEWLRKRPRQGPSSSMMARAEQRSSDEPQNAIIKVPPVQEETRDLVGNSLDNGMMKKRKSQGA